MRRSLSESPPPKARLSRHRPAGLIGSGIFIGHGGIRPAADEARLPEARRRSSSTMPGWSGSRARALSSSRAASAASPALQRLPRRGQELEDVGLGLHPLLRDAEDAAGAPGRPSPPACSAGGGHQLREPALVEQRLELGAQGDEPLGRHWSGRASGEIVEAQAREVRERVEDRGMAGVPSRSSTLDRHRWWRGAAPEAGERAGTGGPSAARSHSRGAPPGGSLRGPDPASGRTC